MLAGVVELPCHPAQVASIVVQSVAVNVVNLHALKALASVERLAHSSSNIDKLKSSFANLPSSDISVLQVASKQVRIQLLAILQHCSIISDFKLSILVCDLLCLHLRFFLCCCFDIHILTPLLSKTHKKNEEKCFFKLFPIVVVAKF